MLDSAGLDLLGHARAGVFDAPKAGNAKPSSVLPVNFNNGSIADTMDPPVTIDRKRVLWSTPLRALNASGTEVAGVLVITSHEQNGTVHPEPSLKQPFDFSHR